MDEQIEFAGMTTNERLYAAGLIDEFDEAAKRRDSGKMNELLTQVDLGSQAEWITGTTLSNPEKYGY